MKTPTPQGASCGVKGERSYFLSSNPALMSKLPLTLAASTQSRGVSPVVLGVPLAQPPLRAAALLRALAFVQRASLHTVFQPRSSNLMRFSDVARLNHLHRQLRRPRYLLRSTMGRKNR